MSLIGGLSRDHSTIDRRTSDRQGIRRYRHAALGFTTIAVSSIFFQKIGLSPEAGVIAFDLPIVIGVVFWLFFAGDAEMVPSRVCAYAAYIILSLISIIFLEDSVKIASFLLIIFVYSPLLFRVTLPRDDIHTIYKIFQRCMGIISILVIMQQVLQYTVGQKYWPNLDIALPDFLLIKGYAYIRPYNWGSSLITPNGVFFLEPSIASYYLAISLVLEISALRRVRYIGLFACALICCMAGTGIATMAITAPFLIKSLRFRSFAISAALLFPLMIAAYLGGAFSHIMARTSEVGDPNKSAYARIAVPYHATINLASNPRHIVSGFGPGASPKGNDQVQWPANKLLFEYGLIATIAFHIFVLVATFGSTENKTLVFAILIPYFFFGGGFLTHTTVMVLVMFCTLFKASDDASAFDRPGPRLRTFFNSNFKVSAANL